MRVRVLKSFAHLIIDVGRYTRLINLFCLALGGYVHVLKGYVHVSKSYVRVSKAMNNVFVLNGQKRHLLFSSFFSPLSLLVPSSIFVSPVLAIMAAQSTVGSYSNPLKKFK